MTIDVEVQYVSDAENIPDQAQIQYWVESALTFSKKKEREKEEKNKNKQSEVVVRVVDREESAQLNQQYRGKQGATNVLSFPFEMPDEVKESGDMNLLGDLVICASVVEEQAQEQGKELLAHWAHMVVHGCLHLIGYDHQEPGEAEKMESLETGVLTEMGFPQPYEER